MNQSAHHNHHKVNCLVAVNENLYTEYDTRQEQRILIRMNASENY